jgi:hypothetical protein
MCNTNNSPIKDSSDTPLDSIFDSTSECAKSLARELFHFSNQVINGLASAIVGSQNPKLKRQMSTSLQKSDKLFEIYLSKRFLLNASLA